MKSELPTIIETPKHFYIDSVDLSSAISDKTGTKIKPLENGKVMVTKTFIAKSYECLDEKDFYDFSKPKLDQKNNFVINREALCGVKGIPSS